MSLSFNAALDCISTEPEKAELALGLSRSPQGFRYLSVIISYECRIFVWGVSSAEASGRATSLSLWSSVSTFRFSLSNASETIIITEQCHKMLIFLMEQIAL